MKISEMSREQLRDHMRASKVINRFDPELKEWQHAFKLARLAGMESMDMGCTGCIKKVREWVER